MKTTVSSGSSALVQELARRKLKAENLVENFTSIWVASLVVKSQKCKSAGKKVGNKEDHKKKMKMSMMGKKDSNMRSQPDMSLERGFSSTQWLTVENFWSSDYRFVVQIEEGKV